MTREKIISIIQREGYDVFTACDLADRCLQEFREGKASKQTYTIGKSSFTITRR